MVGGVGTIPTQQQELAAQAATSVVEATNDTEVSSSAAVPTTTWGSIRATLERNPYFHAGAGMYSLAMLGMFGRVAYQGASLGLRRRFVVSLETTSKDPTYNWLMQWLAQYKGFHFQQMSVISSKVILHANEETTTESVFAPCPGVPHYMFYKGWPIVVNRKRQMERAMGTEVLETLDLYTIGRSPTIMQEIVEEAKKTAVEKDSDKTVIYHNAGPRWIRHAEARSRRPLTSVVLDGNIRDELLADVQQFLNSKPYYTKLGVPYRRGYLLHGPPGCGKSSLVVALAGELRLAICALSLSNRNLDDDSLNSLLNEAPLRSIVLLEDIDRAFTAESRITMSGLLNTLDGVAAQEGRLVFMTTNHVARLDAALIRPGRADVKLEIGLMSARQVRDLFAKFFPQATPEQLDQFTRVVPASSVSPAQLQAHLFLHRESAQRAIDTMPRFLSEVNAFEVEIEKKRKMEEKLKNFQNPPLVRQ